MPKPGYGIPLAPRAPERIAVGQLIVLKCSQRAERCFQMALCLTGASARECR